ncbi:hypothetical protein [Gordonia iterans]
MADGPVAPAPLIVDDRAGSVWCLEAEQVFTIGREGDLAFADNPYLHGRLIGLAFHAGFWWISNVGRYLPIKLIDEETGVQTVLRSGASDVVVTGVLVVFEAGPTTYEISLTVTAPLRPPTLVSPPAKGHTLERSVLTEEQSQLLVAMAEPLLRQPGTGLDRIPTTAAVARRLGWSVAKTNRQLDRLCERLAGAGVAGLTGDGRASAVNRRVRLVEYAMDTRLVTPDDLRLLDGG